MKPRISIVLPTYNRQRTILRAVKSVQAQTFRNFELLVCDDGSADETLDTLQSSAAHDPRIRLFALSHRGANAARNYGLDNARGELIAFQDSDDEWAPEFLSELVGFLDSQPQFDMVFSSHFVSLEGTCQRTLVPANTVDRPTEMLARGNFISTQTILVRRRSLQRTRFDEELQRFQDWDLWLALAAKNIRIAHLDKPLVTLYRQPDSISAGKRTVRTRSHARILRRHWRLFARDWTALSRQLLRILLPRY